MNLLNWAELQAIKRSHPAQKSSRPTSPSAEQVPGVEAREMNPVTFRPQIGALGTLP